MKPRVLIYDWKKGGYGDLYNFLDIKLDSSLLDDVKEDIIKREKILFELNELDGMIFHSTNIALNIEFFIELKKRKFPLIIQTENEDLHKSNIETAKEFKIKYKKMYFVKTYEDLVEKAREVFLKE